MIPQLLATFRAMFTGDERGKAFGLYGAILGFASAFGLILGGVLTEADVFGWSWRSVFLVNLPIALVSFVAAARVVPETRQPSARRPDLLGAVLLVGALVAITYPLLEGRSQGWPAWIWVLFGVGLAALVALGMVEERREHSRVAPLLRTELLRLPAFSAGLVVQICFAAGLQGFFLVFAIWLQTGMDFSPIGAGLTTVAFSVGSFLLAGAAIPLAERYGRVVLTSGGVLLSVGVAGVAFGADHVGMASNPWPIVPGLVVAGAGLALLVIPLVNVVLAAVPTEAAGGAGGVFSTAQQLGGALGVAVVGTVFFSQAGHESLTDAFVGSAPLIAAMFVAAALASLVLPRTAVADGESF
jgi:MFS family permease